MFAQGWHENIMTRPKHYTAGHVQRELKDVFKISTFIIIIYLLF